MQNKSHFKKKRTTENFGIPWNRSRRKMKKKGKEFIRLLFSVYIPILLSTRTIPNVSSSSPDDRHTKK